MVREEIKETIEQGIHPFMKRLFWRIAEGGESFSMDGVWAYNEKAKFVGGKAINLCSYVVTELLEGEEYEEGVKKLKEIIDMSAKLPMQTWGILNAVTGLYRLERKGIRETAVSRDTWERLKQLLDWRVFVDCSNHLALIDLPTNYYGVAFGIARYRELMGWEEEGYSFQLLDRFMEHINQYSGEYEFMDETRGQGRFDRYSILVPAELTASILNTDMELPDKIISMLKKSAKICLNMANEHGYGFSYGRSTGAYGDTGVLQVLGAAARVPGVLDPEEEKLAYAYCAKVVDRFCRFWIDEEMDSINMWEKGRATDAYRNKYRILSENLSLCMQLVDEKGWKNPGCDENYLETALKKMDQNGLNGSFYPFAKGAYHRGLAIVRDGSHVWSLPLISGGSSYYQKSPYLPIPYEQFMVTGVPGAAYADLVPVLTLTDGTRLMPTVYIKEIEYSQGGSTFNISYRQDELCIITEGDLAPYDGIRSETSYQWTPGQITRRDTFHLKPGVQVRSAESEFLTFSSQPQELPNGASFTEGGVLSITAEGYDSSHLEKTQDTPSNHTPEGPLNYHITWKKEFSDETEIVLKWTLTYK